MLRAYYQHLKTLVDGPVDSRTPLEKGLASFQAGDHASALPALETALAAEPGQLDASLALGQMLMLEGQWQAAIGVYRTASARRPSEPGLRFQLAVCQEGLGLFSEAEASFRAVTRLAPTHAEAFTRLGVLLLEAGRSGEALASFDRAVFLDRQALAPRLHIAGLCSASGDYPRALTQLSYAARLMPDHPPVHRALGDIGEKLGDFRQVVAEFSKVVALDAADADLCQRLAHAHRHLGQREQALKAYGLALEMDGTRFAALAAVAELLEELGRYEQALDAYCRLATAPAHQAQAQEGLSRVNAHLGAMAGAPRSIAA